MVERIYLYKFRIKNNKGHVNGSEESENVMSIVASPLGHLCAFLAYKFLPGTSLLLSLFRSLLSSGFILADQGIFCQVPPIKFARTPSRTSLLRDSDHERNGSSHKNFTLAASKRFSQLFSPLPQFFLLLPISLYPRCFRQKSLSFMRLTTRS